MWGRFFFEALSVIVGSGKVARVSGRFYGVGFWIIVKKIIVYLVRFVIF